MNNLKLKEIPVIKNKYYSKKWNVKNGRKKFAEITKNKVCYKISINGFQWQKNTLIECVDHCNEYAGNLFFNKVTFCKLPN